MNVNKNEITTWNNTCHSVIYFNVKAVWICLFYQVLILKEDIMAMYHLVKQAQASILYQNQGAFITIAALYSMFRSLVFISWVLAAKYVDPALRTNIYLAKSLWMTHWMHIAIMISTIKTFLKFNVVTIFKIEQLYSEVFFTSRFHTNVCR